MKRSPLNALRATVTAILGAVLTAFLLLGSGAPAAATGKSHHRPTHPSHAKSITVGGQVSTPARYSAADLAALPQTRLPDEREHWARPALTGVLLESLITAAVPQTPAVKNPDLRVSVVVAGKHDAVAATLAELQPRFGNHPALLVARHHGRHAQTDLVFPGDRGHQRTVHDVRSITVSIADPALLTGLPSGAIKISTDGGSVVVTARKLAKLPQITRTVTFTSGSGQQPRLVTDGDIAGGRYVSGLLGLQVTNTCR